MTRMIARRIFAVSTSAGTDDVVAGMWLPSGTTINGIRGSVSMHTQEVSVNQVAQGALEGWILPVSDPDANETMSAIWDRLVPKDSALNSIDLDTAAADASSFYEPGDVLWEEVIDIGLQPRRIYHKHQMSSLGDGSVFIHQDEESPFLIIPTLGQKYRVGINKRMRVSVPSLLVFAIASPLTTRTSATQATAGMAEEDWFQLKYIDHTLERAAISLFGLIETGAETPWEEAAGLLRRNLDPLVLEADAGIFIAATWFADGEFVFDVSVTGSLGKATISTGR